MSIRLMARVWDDTRFRGTELLVLLCLADHANDNGICWPSVATIARRARCSKRQAFRHLKALEDEGWIDRSMKRPVKGKKWVNLYHVKIPVGTDKSPNPFDDIDDMGFYTDVMDVTGGGDTDDTA